MFKSDSGLAGDDVIPKGQSPLNAVLIPYTPTHHLHNKVLF